MTGFLASVFEKQVRENVNKVDVWKFMDCDEMLHKCWGSWLVALQSHCQFLSSCGDFTSPQGRQGTLPLCLAVVIHIGSAGCCSGLASTREMWTSGVSPVKGCGDDRVEPDKWGEAERAVTVHPGAGGYSGWVWCGTCRRVQRRKTRSSLVVSSDWMRRNGHKLKYKTFHLSVRENKIFFPLYIGVGETLEQISHKPWKLPSMEMFSIWWDVVLGSLLKQTQVGAWTRLSQAVPSSLHLLCFSDLLAL